MKIKFSYPFSKLFIRSTPIDQAKLLQVIRIDISEITQELRDFDTDNGVWKLPAKGPYLLLIFQKEKSSVFTTLRRETPEKLEYYTRAVGQWFDIEIAHEIADAQ